MDLYAQNILDRYKKPFYKDFVFESGERLAVSGQLIRHKEANHSCGDVVEVQIRLEDGRVAGYSFSGTGCAISMAAADMMGDLIDGMAEEEIIKLTKEDIYEMLGIEISVRRSKCALLGLLAIQNGLLEAEKKELRSWKEYHL